MTATASIAQDLLNAPSLEEYYKSLDPVHMGAGWNKREPSIYPVPKKDFLPAHWSYACARPALDGAARLVSTEHAERRNLVLHNPMPGNTYATAKTIVAAYQMIKGHESARSHRHTPNALRFILETGPKAYTIVEGKKVLMEPGDVLLTPSWAWHGHSNDGPDDAYWIDFLDAPLTQLLGPMFFEQSKDSIADSNVEVAENSEFRFQFSQWKPKVQQAPETAPGMRQVEIGPPVLDTLRLMWRRFESGARHIEAETTANCCYAVHKGSGTVVCDGVEINWSHGDVIAIPTWRVAEWNVSEESYLLRVSDESLLDKLNWLHRAGPDARPDMPNGGGTGSF